MKRELGRRLFFIAGLIDYANGIMTIPQTEGSTLLKFGLVIIGAILIGAFWPKEER